MEKPKRIQIKRTRGWKMPPNTVKVTRPGLWGNPFIVNPHVKPGGWSGAAYICVPTVEDAVECFRLFVTEVKPELAERARRELAGKHLACFCKVGSPCHADVLLELANEHPAPGQGLSQQEGR